MPAVPGESLLTTLFADVHYYFSDPSTKPQHHRFSRGSYVYIYYNPSTHQAKLEIANHAGTPDQDAFTGSLNGASLEYSYKHPTLCTLRIDGSPQDQGQWHLPTYDTRNEQKYLYKLHSLDIYLWTEKDAATFLGHMQAVMPGNRQDIKDAPSTVSAPAKALPAEHRDSMSPVVQQLERTAVGTYFPPRAGSTVSAQSIPGPPTPATTAGASSSPPVSPPQQIAAAPFAYNPAAPAAPEPVAYREKTPPPTDDGTGTGLNGTSSGYNPVTQFASVPHGYQNSAQPTPQQAYFSGPPQGVGVYSGTPSSGHQSFVGGVPPPPPGGPSPGHQQQQALSFGPPPTGPPAHQQQQQRAPSFGPPPTDQNTQPTSPPPNQQSFHRQSSYGGLPTTQYASATPSFGPGALASPGFGPSTPGFQPPTPSAPPAYATHTPLASPGLPPPPPQQMQSYGQYNYAAAHAPPQQNSQGAYTGDVHSMAYRPTEAEAAAHGYRPEAARSDSNGSASTKVRLEQRVGGMEKRVGGFLKRLDKMI